MTKIRFEGNYFEAGKSIAQAYSPCFFKLDSVRTMVLIERLLRI